MTPAAVIVETTVWVDYFRDLSTPQTEWLERHLDRQPIVLLDLILCEVLQGISRDNEFRQAQKVLLTLEIHSSGGSQLALQSAQNYRRLRSKGITVRSTIDCIIATYCIRYGYSLLHHDRDFEPFQQHFGLKVVRTGPQIVP